MDAGNTEKLVLGVSQKECRVVGITQLTIGQESQKMPSFVQGIAVVIGSNPNQPNSPDNSSDRANQEHHVIIKNSDGGNLHPEVLSNRALRIIKVAEGVSLTNLQTGGEIKYWLNSQRDQKLLPGQNFLVKDKEMKSFYLQLAPGIFIGKKPVNIN